jgi:hypothetical protein
MGDVAIPNQSLFDEYGVPLQRELDPRSLRRHWLLLLLAALWTLLIVAVVFAYHIAEPSGVLSITTNGHTYVGNPPALTLFDRDAVGARNIVAAPLIGLLVGALSLQVRTRRGTSRASVLAIVVGAFLAAFSLFGLLWGVASIGVVAVLVILSARSIKSTPVGVQTPSVP